ncbi:MAG TPA: hypothetical protein VMY18_06355 [Acidobacteriota bacterium]|nr:hypothetical protein [Acidobacteriota bacterium]
MWDLDTIIRENNRVAMEAMMREPEVAVAQSPQPEAWALAALSQKMKIGPPMLAELLKCFTNIEEIQAFVSMVKEFLPEHEDEILGERRFGRIYKFCYLFAKRYFPLPPYTHESSLSNFVAGLPVELMGMSYSSYHDLEMRPGYVLLLSLVVYPYEGDERDTEDDDVPFNPFDPMKRFNMEAKFEQIANVKDKEPEWRPTRSDITWVKNLMAQLSDGGRWIAPMGFTFIKIDDRNIELRQAENTPEVRETVHRTVLIAEKAGLEVKVQVGETAEQKRGKTLLEVFTGGRVPVVDAVRQIVGEELARRLPAEGWEPETLHKMTDGTPYDGVGDFAAWACQDTGCIVLDSNYGDCDYVEGSGEPMFKWSRYNVDALAKEWPKVQEIRCKIGRIVAWLEADPHERFRELLDFMMALPPYRRRPADPNGKRSSYDPTENWCPLDQIIDFEEDEDDDNETAGEAHEENRVRIRQVSVEDFVEGLDPFE